MHRNQQHDTNTQWEDQRRLLDHWRADRDFLDSNLVYGLALPRKVISTSASRTLGIDQTPIHEIRLIQLMQEGSYDWCLRNLAAGKACYLEMFRSRQEAFFSCSLHRFLKDNRIDFNQLLQEIAIKETFPVTSPYGKTASRQVPNRWRMLVDTWLARTANSILRSYGSHQTIGARKCTSSSNPSRSHYAFSSTS